MTNTSYGSFGDWKNLLISSYVCNTNKATLKFSLHQEEKVEAEGAVDVKLKNESLMA